jgi:hypothetical protein
MFDDHNLLVFVNISGICVEVRECRQESVGCVRKEIRSLLLVVRIAENTIRHRHIRSVG